jgi:dTDP-4-dehydrorhamnose 3,5-epimerase
MATPVRTVLGFGTLMVHVKFMSRSGKPSPLPLVIVPKRRPDARGWFSETFLLERWRELGIGCSFVQDNQSLSSRKGTLRGFHFQEPPAAQAKLVSVARGRILDVAVDIRRGSPSFGKFVSVELSSDNGRQIFVPVGFAHGFVTLQDEVLVMYKASEYYAPSCEGGIRWNDPDIGVPWPFDAAATIRSERDDRLPLLKDYQSPFRYDGEPLGELPTVSL